MQRMKNINAFLFGLTIVVLLAFAMEAKATKTKPSMLEQQQKQYQDQLQKQKMSQSSTVNTDVVTGAVETVAESTNEGNSLSVESNYDAGPGDLVLVPNNNTETCLRVWGLAFGNDNASAMLGVPFRSKKCDYEQAADDAFAAGERELGWFWKCQNPSLYKTFRDKGESAATARQQCHDYTIGEMSNKRTIEYLTEKVRILQEEQTARRLQHEESVNRLQADCKESKDRILQGCVK